MSVEEDKYLERSKGLGWVNYSPGDLTDEEWKEIMWKVGGVVGGE